MNPPSKNLLPEETLEALKRTGMSEDRFREIEQIRENEIAGMDEQLLYLYREQHSLFIEIEKASEAISPSGIYAAVISVMNLFERVMSRAGPPIREGEPEVVVAGMTKFKRRLIDAEDKMLSTIEKMSARSLSIESTDRLNVLGTKTTRIVILGRLLSNRLATSAPICALDARWMATTVLADLERLSEIEFR